MAPPRRYDLQDILRIRGQYQAGAKMADLRAQWSLSRDGLRNILQHRVYKDVGAYVAIRPTGRPRRAA